MAEEPNEKKKGFKFADAPHYISVILSIAALIISGLSWRESHRSRLVSETSNRALVYAILLKPVNVGPKLPSTTYQLVVKNLGKINALNVGYEYDVLSYSNDGEEEKKLETVTTLVEWAELPPGLEREVQIRLFSRTKNPNEHFRIKGILVYYDEATGEKYEQKWCFRIEDRNPGLCL
jgi:hypothetical protein